MINIDCHKARVLRMTACLIASLGAVSAVAQGGDCAADSRCPSLELGAAYAVDLRRNMSGGFATGTALSGLLELGAVWKSDGLIPNAFVTTRASVIYSDGDALSADLVGDLQGLNNIEAPPGWRLYEVWSEISFGSQQAASARAGFLDLNAEFDVSDTFGFFIGPPFGIGTDLAQTGENGPAVFPVTSLGLRLAGRIGESAAWRMAAFDGVPGRVDSNSFVAVDVTHNQGALLIGELEFSPPGVSKIAVGAWSYTASFDRIDAQAINSGVRAKGNRGAYALVDAPLGTIGSIEFNGAVRMGVADSRFNAVKIYVGGALLVSHIVASRPDDALGLAIAHGRTGRPLRTQMAFDGTAPLKAETAIELTWRTQLSSWLALAPTLQWVDSPGANRALRNAWIAGLRFDLSIGHSWPLLARQEVRSD
jgi:porin